MWGDGRWSVVSEALKRRRVVKPHKVLTVTLNKPLQTTQIELIESCRKWLQNTRLVNLCNQPTFTNQTEAVDAAVRKGMVSWAPACQ